MIFDFFKKKIEEISLDDIDRFCAEYVARTGLQEEFAGFVEFFEEKKASAEAALGPLKEAEPSRKNLPPKALHLLHGNKRQFLQEIGHLLAKLDAPEDLLAIPVFHESLQKSLTGFMKTTQKSYLVLNELLSEELSKVLRPLKEIEEASLRLARKVEKKSLGNIAHIKEKLEFLEAEKQARDVREKMLLQFRSDLESVQAKKAKVLEAIEKIKKGERYGAYLALKRSLDDQEKKVKELRREIAVAFSEVERPLKTLARDADNPLLDRYLEDSASAILDDLDLVILSFLKDASRLLPEMGLGKKEPRVKKALSALTQLFLEEKANQLRSESDVLADLDRSLRQNASLLGLKEQEGYLEFTESQEADVQKKVDAMQHKLDQFDRTGTIREIDDLLLALGARLVGEG